MQFCLSVELRKLLLANEFEGSFGKQKTVQGPVFSRHIHLKQGIDSTFDGWTVYSSSRVYYYYYHSPVA